MRNGESVARRAMDRRGFLATSGAVLSAAGLAACGGSSGGGGSSKSSKVHLTLTTFAAPGWTTMPKAVIAKYTKDHPNVSVDVLIEGADTFAQMIAAKAATPDQNIVDIGFYNAQQFAQGVAAGLFDTIHPSEMPLYKHVLPTYRPANLKGIGCQAEIEGLIYNTKYVKTPPTSWADLWSPAFNKKMLVWEYDWDMLLMAAYTLTGKTSNMGAAFKIFQQHAGNIAAQVQTNTQFENLLRSGDAWLAAWSNDVSAAWIKSGEPFQWVMPKEGGESRPLYMAITSNLTPAQRKVALYIINEFLTPEVAGKHAANTSQISVVDNAIIPASLKNGPYTNPKLLQHTVLPDWASVGKNDAAWRQQWNSDVASRT
jgi:putative spermidine/putrescine transport system substrate-binding protein